MSLHSCARPACPCRLRSLSAHLPVYRPLGARGTHLQQTLLASFFKSQDDLHRLSSEYVPLRAKEELYMLRFQRGQDAELFCTSAPLKRTYINGPENLQKSYSVGFWRVGTSILNLLSLTCSQRVINSKKI